MHPNRRDIVKIAAGGLVLGACSSEELNENEVWDQGHVWHLIPAASSHEFLIKASFVNSPKGKVTLKINDLVVQGESKDSSGRFWTFHAKNLNPNREYSLQMFAGEEALCGSWPLKTFPRANSQPKQLRLALYTCAGGLSGMSRPNGKEVFNRHSTRQKLIERALSFNPNAVVANGDHVYWDIQSQLNHANENTRKAARELFDQYGYFDFEDGFEGTTNEAVLNKVVGAQIADLYGARLRSTPSYFLCDDHDYFENDESNERMTTFPPQPFLVEAQRATADRYYPRFLPDPTRPADLPGTDISTGISDAFGTLRFGQLFEAQLFDCGRFLSLGEDKAGLIPQEVEDWLVLRTHDDTLKHLVQIPSHPMGWSAGKWREWYPDVVVGDGVAKGDTVSAVLDENSGQLSNQYTKFGWQTGWWLQHQRLLQALSGQPDRAAVSISGDLHAVCHASISQSGNLDLSENVVHSILSGPISSSTLTWASAARGTVPEVPGDLEAEQPIDMLEQNGFTIIDVDPIKIRVRQFAWDKSKGEKHIETMPPVADFIITRSA